MKDESAPLPEQTPERLVQVTAPHFCAGIVFQRGKCVSAAPILRWAIGKGWRWFHGYCQGKGWKVVVLDPETGEWRDPR